MPQKTQILNSILQVLLRDINIFAHITKFYSTFIYQGELHMQMKLLCSVVLSDSDSGIQRLDPFTKLVLLL